MESIKYNEIEVKIDYENNTIWLTQNQISKLFNISQAKVSKNINAITKSWNKLSPTYSKLEYVQREGDRKVTRNVKVYNLEIIRVIGYKINSDIINDFIKWVEGLFKDYSSKKAILTKKDYEIVTFIDNELQIDVNVDIENDTVWLTQEQISILFDKSVSTINWHIKNILNSELYDNEVVRQFEKIEFNDWKENFNFNKA